MVKAQSVGRQDDALLKEHSSDGKFVRSENDPRIFLPLLLVDHHHGPRSFQRTPGLQQPMGARSRCPPTRRPRPSITARDSGGRLLLVDHHHGPRSFQRTPGLQQPMGARSRCPPTRVRGGWRRRSRPPTVRRRRCDVTAFRLTPLCRPLGRIRCVRGVPVRAGVRGGWRRRSRPPTVRRRRCDVTAFRLTPLCRPLSLPVSSADAQKPPFTSTAELVAPAVPGDSSSGPTSCVATERSGLLGASLPVSSADAQKPPFTSTAELVAPAVPGDSSSGPCSRPPPVDGEEAEAGPQLARLDDAGLA